MKNGKVSIKGIVEGVSVLAVVLTLIFVGIQLNENTKATRSAIAAETITAISQWYNNLGGNHQKTQVMRNFIREPETLSVEDQYQAMLLTQSYFLILQNSFYLEEEGTLNTDIRVSLSSILPVSPGMRFFWKQRRSMFTNERFKSFVDQQLLGELSHSKSILGSTSKE